MKYDRTQMRLALHVFWTSNRSAVSFARWCQMENTQCLLWCAGYTFPCWSMPLWRCLSAQLPWLSRSKSHVILELFPVWWIEQCRILFGRAGFPCVYACPAVKLILHFAGIPIIAVVLWLQQRNYWRFYDASFELPVDAVPRCPRCETNDFRVK